MATVDKPWLCNWSRLWQADVIMLNYSGFEGPEIVAWEKAGPEDKCESDDKPALYVSRDLSLFGTHGDVGMCAECWDGYVNDPSVHADAVRIFTPTKGE